MSSRILLIFCWCLIWSYGFGFSSSAWYFEAIDVSPSTVQLLRSMFNLSCLVFAPVAGAVADRFGSILLLRLGFATLFLASALYATGQSIYLAILAEICIAFGQAAAFASIYPLLYLQLRSDAPFQFSGILGKLIAFEAVFWLLSNSIGSYCAAKFGPHSPWWIAMSFYLAGFLLSFLLSTVETRERTRSLNESFRALVPPPDIFRIYLPVILLSAAYRAVMYLEPEYLKWSGVSQELAGVIVGFSYLPVAMSALFAWRIERAFTLKRIINSLFAAHSLAFFGMFVFALSGGWIFVLLHTTARGIGRVLVYAEGNRHSKDKSRSMTNSMINFVERLGATIILFLLGILLFYFGMSGAVLILSVLLGVFALIGGILARKP